METKEQTKKIGGEKHRLKVRKKQVGCKEMKERGTNKGRRKQVGKKEKTQRNLEKGGKNI